MDIILETMLRGTIIITAIYSIDKSFFLLFVCLCFIGPHEEINAYQAIMMPLSVQSLGGGHTSRQLY